MPYPPWTTSHAEPLEYDEVEQVVANLGPADDDQRGHARARTDHLRYADNVKHCGNAGLPTGREAHGNGVAIVV